MLSLRWAVGFAAMSSETGKFICVCNTPDLSWYQCWHSSLLSTGASRTANPLRSAATLETSIEESEPDKPNSSVQFTPPSQPSGYLTNLLDKLLSTHVFYSLQFPVFFFLYSFAVETICHLFRVLHPATSFFLFACPLQLPKISTDSHGA